MCETSVAYVVRANQPLEVWIATLRHGLLEPRVGRGTSPPGLVERLHPEEDEVGGAGELDDAVGGRRRDKQCRQPDSERGRRHDEPGEVAEEGDLPARRPLVTTCLVTRAMSGPGTTVTTTEPTRKTRRWCGTGGSYEATGKSCTPGLRSEEVAAVLPCARTSSASVTGSRRDAHLTSRSVWSKNAVMRRSYSFGRASMPPACPLSGTSQIALGSRAAL